MSRAKQGHVSYVMQEKVCMCKCTCDCAGTLGEHAECVMRSEQSRTVLKQMLWCNDWHVLMFV